MKLIELIDPIQIPPTPVHRARLQADLVKLAVWLVQSIMNRLHQTQPPHEWDLPGIKEIFPVQQWKTFNLAPFPKVNDQVWQLFVKGNLVVGVWYLGNRGVLASYSPKHKYVILNAQSLPEYLDSTHDHMSPDVVNAVAHELKHAYDDLISKGKGLASDAIVTGISYSDYLSLPEEVRARFQQSIPDLIQELYFPDGAVKDVSYFKLVVPQILQKHQLHVTDLSDHAQPQKLYQRLIKQAYLFKQGADQLPQSERAHWISQLKQVKSVQQLKNEPWWRKIIQKLRM